MQRIQEACVRIQQEQLAGLHRDAVAILWHSTGKPTVRSGPPPTELEGKVALEERMIRLVSEAGWHSEQWKMVNAPGNISLSLFLEQLTQTEEKYKKDISYTSVLSS